MLNNAEQYKNITINLNDIVALLNSSISTTVINQHTGLSRGTIGDYRQGRKQLANMTLETAIRLSKLKGVDDHETRRSDGDI